jgi:hypothetical protein
MSARACVVCGASLEGKRGHARHCSTACRTEASRLARILAGQSPGGYATLSAWQSRQRRTK